MPAFHLSGNPIVAEHDAENARGARGVAVGVLARPRRHVERPVEVALAVQQAERDERAVEPRVDVEIVQRAIRARIVAIPLLGEARPGLLPVGLGRGPVEQVADDAAVAAVGRNRLEADLDDPARIALEERGRVHPAEEHAAVQAVSVVHDAPDAIGNAVGLLRQAGRHQADEIRLDLEVDVVGVRVVLRVPRPGRLDAAVEQVPRGGVGVPQLVLRVLEHLAELLGGRVEADFVEHLGKRHLDVEVVLPDRVADVLGLPLDHPADDAAVRPELGRRAVRHADHLAGPPAADLVLEHGS